MKTHCVMLLALLITNFPGEARAVVSPSVAEPAAAAIKKGVEFLLTRQQDNGSWIDHPAITGLCVVAIHDTNLIDRQNIDATVHAGLDYVLTFVKPDGSIWSEQAHQYPNYTTAICLLALSTVNRPEDLKTIQNARDYLQDSQFQDRTSIDYGGIGYSKTGRADITNLSFAAESLYYTDYLDREPYNNDPAAARKVKELWRKVQVFITNSQNSPELNKQPWVSTRDEDYGGFVYRPNESKAGALYDESGKVTLLSSGSVTYSGLMSMMYAKMDKDDHRVRGAMDYTARHYTLKENPGMGTQGLFFYLTIMTKAFAAYGEDTFVDANGESHNWREEILSEFLVLQKEDGSWINDNGRYMESVPELVTAHSVTAMKIALR